MSRDNDFIEKLLSYAENKDRAALAALRRGLGKNIGEATEPYRYIFPYLPSKSSKQEQEEK
ncbi:MAG: type I-E CRISPR-associated protein Cse2/CasB, partial [Blastocatellia bacterium]|nr:type I-E CRISPR-associated protein Cse2/CasB [Blastocatellia bacterium]